MADNAFSIDSAEAGVLAALNAVISVAQTSMAQAAVKGDAVSASMFVGFLQAVVGNKEAFANQILTKLIAELEAAQETANADT